MYSKVTANGEDITDRCYLDPQADVVRGGSGGLPATQPLFPFADKSKHMEETFRKWGDFSLIFTGSTGLRAGYLVRLQNVALTTTKRDSYEVVELTLRVLGVAPTG